MRILLPILGLATLTLGACATTDTSQSEAAVTYDYGIAPIVNKADIKAYMSDQLKDSESARYRFDEPQKTVCNKGALSGGKVAWNGWVVPFTVNAKNSYGGYVGLSLIHI